MNESKTLPQQISILGGGIAALTTAFELTESPYYDPAKCKITIYQMGWRLGGKGASGRNSEKNDRIEEHGLHLWMGCYQNAFSLIQKCYEEVIKKKFSNPLSWEDAFKPQSFAAILEKLNDEHWSKWTINFPTNPEKPGGKNPSEFPTFNSYVKMLMSASTEYLKYNNSQLSSLDKFFEVALLPEWLSNLIKNMISELKIITDFSLIICLQITLKTFDNILENLFFKNAIAEPLLTFLKLNKENIHKKIESFLNQDLELRKIWISVDIVISILSGLANEGLLFNGDLEKLDNYDFREWLKKQGAFDCTINSAPVKSLYEMAFAYEEGDVNKPNFAAGAYLQSAYRIFLTYKGAIFYKMDAGMGDAVFTPLYLTLKSRGVNLEFFHKITELKLSPDKSSIQQIKIIKQVNIKGNKEYDPLVSVKGLHCWPSNPLFEQILEGDEIKAKKINLESSWSDWKGVENITLNFKQDFDIVVLGIPIGVFREICPELISASDKFRLMVENLKTVQTQSIQLWINEDLDGLGWKNKSVVLSCFEEPLNTWADMSHLIDKESWDKERVKNISYFCGPMLDSPLTPSDSHSDYLIKKEEEVIENSITMLQQNIQNLWANANTPNNGKSNSFRWDLLVSESDKKDKEKLYSQFFRANIESSERYVLSLKGSTQYRLESDDSGFKNLYLTGDWTRNVFNAGSVEASVISGMKASRAISGYPKNIVGEKIK